MNEQEIRDQAFEEAALLCYKMSENPTLEACCTIGYELAGDEIRTLKSKPEKPKFMIFVPDNEPTTRFVDYFGFQVEIDKNHRYLALDINGNVHSYGEEPDWAEDYGEWSTGHNYKKVGKMENPNIHAKYSLRKY